MATDDAILTADLQVATTRADELSERARWWAQHGASRYAQRSHHTNTPDRHRPLRIGYVSGDLFLHSAVFVYGNLIGAHAPEFATTIVYSTTPAERYDHITAQLVTKFGPNFRDVSAYAPETLAQMVREDRIDILVDLSGYTPGNRLRTFAEKPAPIQLTGWGYATGLGWPAGVMDGLIGDPYVFLPAMRATLTEPVLDLPCLLAYTVIDELPPVGPAPCLRGTPPAFGVFQRTMKIQPENLRLWDRLLAALPQATLVFKGHAHVAPLAWQAWVRQHFASTAQDRLDFQPVTNQGEHFRAFTHLDLSLDPWPQTGGVSTLESLAMGVPVVTLVGDRPIQRTTASINHVLGLDEFSTTTEDAYLEMAVAWVTTLAYLLAPLRAGLRARLQRSPICRGYAQAVEQHYRRLWETWCDRATESAA